MPGPGNSASRKKQQRKKEKKAKKKLQAQTQVAHTGDATTPLEPSDEYVNHSGEQYQVYYEQEIAGDTVRYITENGDYIVQNQDYIPETHQYEYVVEVDGDNPVYEDYEAQQYQQYYQEQQHQIPEDPCIYDPGNGPRVKDFLAFMRSPFAAPQAFNEEDEAPFGDLSAANVLPLLSKILPGELASVSIAHISHGFNV